MPNEDELKRNTEEADEYISQYFAAVQDPQELGHELAERVEDYYEYLNTKGIAEIWRTAYRHYYGLGEDGSWHQSSSIDFDGDQGELALYKINHYRNLLQHMIVLTTQNRPTFEARAVNRDYKTMAQTHVARGILEYYMREQHIERKLKMAVEFSLLFGEGFNAVTWDPSAGMRVPVENGEAQQGDVRVETFSPLDVIRDWRRDGNEADWQILRRYKNRYDLAARYPEYSADIVDMAIQNYPRLTEMSRDDHKKSDDIAVYEFYHRRSDALPDGRHVIFVNPEVILFDGPLPYKEVPIYRISPADFLGSTFGYSSGWDLLGIQQVIDAMSSVQLSNYDAHGLQNVVMEQGTDMSEEDVVGGLQVWKIQRGAMIPAGINLTQMPQGIESFVDTNITHMETISGVNKVARGDPQASLKSGAALALVQSQAIQFNSGLQQSYNQLLEDTGTGVLNVLKSYAEVPRMAMIAGIDDRYQLKEFTKEDISAVDRVVVDAGNPLSRTIAGRLQIADTLLERGLVKTPEQYFTVLNTGRLDSMYKGTEAQLQRIRMESEMLAKAPAVTEGMDEMGMPTFSIEGMGAFALDQHSLHIKEHMSVLATAEAQTNPEVLQAVMAHVQQHVDLLKTTDPNLLMIIGEQPILPPMMDPAAQGPPPSNPSEPGASAPPLGDPMAQAGQAGELNMPNMPKNPLTGEPSSPGVGIPPQGGPI